MTNEELNTTIYNRMVAELAEYSKWLLNQTQSEILRHCREYADRERIVQCMGDTSLTDRQARALLKCSTPLEDVYREYQKTELRDMERLRDLIEARANSALRAEARKGRK